MNRRLIIAAFIIALSYPAWADDHAQAPANNREPTYTGLGDMMIVTQLRHFKLWYVGRVGNWRLANYELARMRAAFADAERLYQNTSSTNAATMLAADEIDSAIEAKDSSRFTKAFGKLTAACNNCHKAMGFDFIAIREPRLSPIETSPFSDEAFTPR